MLLLMLAEESVEVEGEDVAHPSLPSRISATAAASSPFKHAWTSWTSHKCLFMRRNRSISRRHGFIDFRWGHMTIFARLNRRSRSLFVDVMWERSQYFELATMRSASACPRIESAYPTSASRPWDESLPSGGTHFLAGWALPSTFAI